MAIENLIVEASTNPLDPEHNFKIAVEYEALGQTAAAVSFYLRAAEYGFDSSPLIVYNSLLKVSNCVDRQKDRTHTSINSTLQAIAYMPSRPEAYFLLARAHENQQNWQECYTFAEVGLQFNGRFEPLHSDVGYPGLYGLFFQKAVSGWWIGRKEESKRIFEDMLANPDVAEVYKAIVRNNLGFLNQPL
jgi:tetratricopeptide (TPR) repeat protein